MELLVANFRGTPKRVWRKGREYIVAHASIINPGVLNGSKGRLYYPPEECVASATAWNGIPLTAYHPQDPLTGQHQSAAEHGVWARQGIGRVRNTTFGGKLRSEAWFDVQRTRNADSRFGTNMVQRLERGEPIELSTGLFTDNEVAPPGAVDARGRAYDYIARNYRPDHLAILPTQTGACSVRDGCGVLVNRAGPDITGLKRVAKFLSKNGAMPGYGQVFVKDHEVWYVGGDGDEWERKNLPVELFGNVPGVDKVTYEAESFPSKDGTWTKVVNRAAPDDCDDGG